MMKWENEINFAYKKVKVKRMERVNTKCKNMKIKKQKRKNFLNILHSEW